METLEELRQAGAYNSLYERAEKAEELRDLYQGRLGKTKLDLRKARIEVNEMAEDCTSWMERAEKAEAELAEARKGLDDFVKRCDTLVDERERLREECDTYQQEWVPGAAYMRLREALEEIANPDYEWGISAIAIYQTMQKIARDALAGGQGEQES